MNPTMLREGHDHDWSRFRVRVMKTAYVVQSEGCDSFIASSVEKAVEVLEEQYMCPVDIGCATQSYTTIIVREVEFESTIFTAIKSAVYE